MAFFYDFSNSSNNQGFNNELSQLISFSQNVVQEVKKEVIEITKGFNKIIIERVKKSFRSKTNHMNINNPNYNYNYNKKNYNNNNNYIKNNNYNINNYNQIDNNNNNYNVINNNNNCENNFESLIEESKLNDINQFTQHIQPEMKHLRGLVNIASTCYMNSVLQCFSHIKELAVYFQTNKMDQLVIQNQNNKKFFPVFQEIIKNLWDIKDYSAYPPYNFKQRLGEMNPLFQGAYPNDAKDFLTFILLKLHDELNKSKNNNNNFNNMTNVNMQENKKLMFKSFSNYFVNNYRSIISGLFYGLFYTETRCNLGHTFYNYQTFNFLIFPLEKVLEYKIKANNNMSNFNNTVTLDDCFKHYEFPTILNNYYCNKCRNTTNCSYVSKLSVLPNIIIIILNRGKGLQYKVNISFENENLGLGKYVEYCTDESIYELIGLVTHYGDSSASGHFIARCKSPIDNEWYLYNDQIVEKIGYFNNVSFAQGNPYILFYKKINFQK